MTKRDITKITKDSACPNQQDGDTMGCYNKLDNEKVMLSCLAYFHSIVGDKQMLGSYVTQWVCFLLPCIAAARAMNFWA
jgi:hypothetical protein